MTRNRTRGALKRPTRTPIKGLTPNPKDRLAMNLSPEQIQEHISKLSDATVEDLDDLLHDLFCLAWPTTDGQNN
jgi:hypothetical protein